MKRLTVEERDKFVESQIEKIRKNPYSLWISVKERLPEDGQRCLIFDKSKHVYWDINKPETIINIYCANFEKGEHKPNGPWRSCDTGFGNNQFPWSWHEGPRTWNSQYIPFWQPLPEPPEETK